MSSLPHHDNERQLSISIFGSCILCNQGIARIFDHITDILTALVVQNTAHKRKNIDSKIIDIATWKAFKQWLLDVE